MMFEAPDHWHNVSLQLASVLEDIDISERLVRKRRIGCLLGETLINITHKVIGRDISVYNFGSQSEGTTTPGINSDFDFFGSINHTNVLQDLSDWAPGVQNLLMHQDENTPPGYCMLQWLYNDVPLPVAKELGLYKENKVVINNTFINKLMTEGQTRDGPSISIKQEESFKAQINVSAFLCRSMPKSVQQWLNKQVVSRKLSPDMIRSIESSTCFVVPVGISEFRDYERRISTSHMGGFQNNEDIPSFSYNMKAIGHKNKILH